ncbi:peptidase domain-containing ABC transporter [Gilvibacter sediminis]|uniref:peptidase domain-containing ABC transporter n=1 Tax=Gilvibacter sediminis TaxID=379071 RepID=UPI00234FB8A3|nr:peptidase domain-containing ABC transporter [Gilvibacter sediminis]MDC7997402.1 peptidase domain-containing ABC transporter [Gilvibacter sediminis]
MKKFPTYQQPDSKDCGPTCLRIVAKFYGKSISLPVLRALSETTREGSSLLALSETAEKIGLRSLGVKLNLDTLNKANLPCVLHWNDDHFVVLYKIRKGKYYVSDPAHGLIVYNQQEFTTAWLGANADHQEDQGIALLLEATPQLKNFDSEDPEEELKFGFLYLAQYVLRYKKFIWQLVLGLFCGSLLALVVPFLTQSLVDVGIKNRDLDFVYLILFAQIALFFGRSTIEIIRSWILLHLSTRINISIISDFFIKLMNLPIAFFDTKMTGDIMQRINDHQRIEKILTTSSLTTVFSAVNFVIFSLVLLYYDVSIFGIFAIATVAYFGWIVIFLKKRKELDYKRFSQISKEQSQVIEMINGMQEIKLHNAERQKRWNWEGVQARLFKISIKNLSLEQFQAVGSSLINELKNIVIVVVSAQLVVKGSITLGMMLAITYIVGQLNAPVQQFINFIRELQDAKISLERLAEIHSKEDELSQDRGKLTQAPKDQDINLDEVDFRYTGSPNMVLKDLSLTIPANKITAIVGTSGSGKTTLMKMLLKFYEPTHGRIEIGNLPFENISSRAWRSRVGVVMQEGYIFNDSIARNIAVGDNHIDTERLNHAAGVANITEFVEELPKRFDTEIGMEGIGLSTGQKQRILIARAVYKNPDYLFFDEATSALDTNNEKTIMENLNRFFENKTVVVIAHRLSTVKNADNIVVLDQGKIIEQGTHKQLVAQRKNYYELVKNQLELGA